jgi:hypothetical protein
VGEVVDDGKDQRENDNRKYASVAAKEKPQHSGDGANEKEEIADEKGASKKRVG